MDNSMLLIIGLIIVVALVAVYLFSETPAVAPASLTTSAKTATVSAAVAPAATTSADTSALTSKTGTSVPVAAAAIRNSIPALGARRS